MTFKKITYYSGLLLLLVFSSCGEKSITDQYLLEEVNGRRCFELNLTNFVNLYRSSDEDRKELFSTLGMKDKTINSKRRVMYYYPSEGERKSQFVVIDKVRTEVSIGWKLADPREKIEEIAQFENEHSDDFIPSKEEYLFNYSGTEYGAYVRKIGNMKMVTLYSRDFK